MSTDTSSMPFKIQASEFVDKLRRQIFLTPVEEAVLRAAGIRNFEKKTYSGAGSLPAGSTRVLSMREVHGTSPHVVKGQAKVEAYFYVTALIVHYTP